MRVCVVTPPSPFLLDQRVFPALGILKVAAVLEQAGMAVDHLDLTGVENYEDAARDYSGESTVFAVTATTPQMPAAIRVRKAIAGRGKTILGGPHATLVSTAAKNGNPRAKLALEELLSTFDCVVAGDGEKAIFTALHSKGLVDADDPKSIMWQSSKDFTDSPWPARHLLDMESYHYSIDGARAVHLISQLGCPMASVTGDTFVFTSMGLETIEELKQRQTFGRKEKCIHGADIVTYAIQEPIMTQRGRQIASVLMDEGVRDVYELRHKFGMPLRGTAEHRVLVVNGDGLIWKRMDEIKGGDWIACKFPDPASCEYQPLTIVPKLRTVPPGGFHARPIKVPTLMDEELAWLVGFVLGDGCIPMDGRPAIHVCVTPDVRERLIRVFKEKFDVELKIYATDVTTKMEHGWIYSRKVYEFFVQTLGISPSRKLNVPSVIRQSPASVIQAFLDGLWDADGYEDNKGSSYLTTVDGEFARQISMMLLLVRKIPFLRRVDGVGYKSGRCWRVGIAQADKIPMEKSLYKSATSARWFWRTKKSANRAGIRRRTLRESGLHHALDIEGMFYSLVEDVVPVGKETVYDLTVPGEENFVANGVVVHNCTFCSGRNSPMLRRIRLRPPENVIAEVLHLHQKYGYTGFNFFDDELNVNREMLALMRGLRDAAKSLGVEWRLRGFIKAELFTEEQAGVMYEAGFRWILTGFESGSDRILVNINKKATRDENTRCVKIARSHGLKVKALMSLGHAGESEETVIATYDWLLETKPDEIDVTVITPYPGSPYWDDAVHIGQNVWRYTAPKTGDVLYMEEVDFTQTADYYKGIMGSYVSHVWTDHLDREELVAQRDWLEVSAKKELGITMLQTVAATMYDNSMGMTPMILRSSK